MPPKTKTIDSIMSAVSALFSGENNQSDDKKNTKVHAMGLTLEQLEAMHKKSEIDKFFGTGVGLKKTDLDKFNSAVELFEKEQGDDGSNLSLIDFIKNSRAGKGSLPGFANILTDPNVSEEQLPGLFQAYAEFNKNPRNKDPLPKYRVPQELLSAFGKENAPVIKEFFKQMYPEGDFTSVADIQGALKLGDKPGGLTLDIGSLMSPDYYGGSGRGGWHLQSNFMETPPSGKYSVYQSRPDAIEKNRALQQRGSINPEKEIISAFGEKSKYSSSVPSSSSSINIGSWPNVQSAENLRRTLLHEFGHEKPQFAKDTKVEGYNPDFHQAPFEEMIDKSLGGVINRFNRNKNVRSVDITEFNTEGGRESSTAIRKAYMESLERKQIENHPMSQFVQMLMDEGINPTSLFGQHIGTQKQSPKQ